MTTDYLTPEDVARHLQVSRQVVYNWINDGRLRAVKAGRTLRIPHYALEAFLQPVHVGDISTGGIEPDGYAIERFTATAQAAFAEAEREVRTRQHIQLEVEHILWGLVQQADGIGQQLLQHLGIDPHQVTQQLDQALAKLPNDPSIQHSPDQLAVAASVPPVIERAEALAGPELQIDASHILLAICEAADNVSAQILHSFGVTPERLRVGFIYVRASQHVHTPQTTAHSRLDWEQRIEQQLVRIETELVAIRSMLTQRTSTDTA